MKIITQATGLSSGKVQVCLAIGMFDGVHLGHQQILRNTVADAERTSSLPVAITFDRHPNSVVAPERTPALIYPLPQRLQQIGALGIGATLLIHFDRAFSQKRGEDFVAELVDGLGRVRSIWIGSDFSFGHKRSGNVGLLQQLSSQYGFEVHALAPVCWQGQVVSSTRIREEIERGDLDTATALLGRRYSVAAKVGRGEQLGQKLGFPTANLEIAGLVLPPAGVYAGFGRLGEKSYQAVANLGFRPTLQRPELTLRLEVHLLGFDGDLYGEQLEFVFGAKLRGEEKFSSLDALQAQIRRDIASAATLLRPGVVPSVSR